ncbi:uncharacterized protein LOC135150469 [Daucus carota subsp. sativus]|uniref:uncharacterized protein LOC135150469 n=1 Tax=Daucus carota subsp. sativus TaxID=79200 RepID=UPI003082A092
MSHKGQVWINLPRFTEEYSKGVGNFVKNAMVKYAVDDELKCPCSRCKSKHWWGPEDVYNHLICKGPSLEIADWVYDVSNMNGGSSLVDSEANMGFDDDLEGMLNITYANRGPNADARKFYRLVEDGKKPLYPGSKKHSRLSFLVRIYHWKCLSGVTESGFSGLLEILKEAFPEIEVPSSFFAAKKVIRDLGLDYEKIHACPNDCMIYWGKNKDLVSCTSCGVSRWSDKQEENKKNKIPAKVMRYFPLKPRLQRLYMCEEISKLMLWHAVDRKKDGKLRHPADGISWKTMDAKYPMFSSENRNVRLGLASDGFNPFRTMSLSHSTWPIILVNYNLPPWLNMKPENLILSTLIPGPNDPGNNIDVYMQPLIEELKELWDVGVETYDASRNQNFMLRASVLWTISDFPGYGMLSGWSTKGYLACPICSYETSSMYLKNSRKMCYMNHRRFLDSNHKWRSDKRRFNGQVEVGQAPPVISGSMIKKLLAGYQNKFGKVHGKRKVSCDVNPWNKKSIFFDLPYWSENSIRHNLDVMHIEKNLCDSILGTLLNIPGKTKDHLNARLDLQELGIRKVLHPITSTDGKHLEIRAANFDMTNKEKDIFCSVFENAKFPYGFASNISKCVQDRKIVGYKSHDAHIIMQYLLEIAVKKALKPEVAVPLIRLGEFLRKICSKVIEVEDIKKLQQDII